MNEKYYTPVGLVQIYDADSGELVCETHNMIVKEGRKRILQALFSIHETAAEIVSKINTKITAYENETDETEKETKKTELKTYIDSLTITGAFLTAMADADWYTKITATSKTDSTKRLKSSYTALITVNNNSTGMINVSNFFKYYESASTTLTAPEMVYDGSSTSSYNIKNNIATSGEVPQLQAIVDESGVYSSFTLNDITYTDSVNLTDIQMNLHMKVSQSDLVSKPITAIGLLYKTGTNTYELFSRAAIDPVYMRYGRTYIVHYTLYF